jgi:hypothetical protein
VVVAMDPLRVDVSGFSVLPIVAAVNRQTQRSSMFKN